MLWRLTKETTEDWSDIKLDSSRKEEHRDFQAINSRLKASRIRLGSVQVETTLRGSWRIYHKHDFGLVAKSTLSWAVKDRQGVARAQGMHSQALNSTVSWIHQAHRRGKQKA